MFKLSCKIVINGASKITYTYVNNISVETSIDNYTDTCTITIPRKFKHKNKPITDFIKRDDNIFIYLGYDDVLTQVFTGYITNIGTGTPLVIKCENNFRVFKKRMVKPFYYKQLNLTDFIKEYVTDFDTKVTDLNLGEVRISEETTLAKVLDYFANNFPINFFFRENIFYAGLPLTLLTDIQNTVKFKTGRNIISDNLEYTLAEDVNLQIIAKAILRNNTKIEYTEPKNADDAEIRTFYVPGATTVEDLKIFAVEKLATLKIDKMTGDIVAFGKPYVLKGDVIHLFDDINSERNDKKFVARSVKYDFGVSGYRQTIKLGDAIK